MRAHLDGFWEAVAVFLLLAPGVAVGLWALVTWQRSLRSNKSCPHCRHGIHADDVAMMTGNCSHCGCPAVGGPYPGVLAPTTGTAGVAWMVEAYRARASSLRQRYALCCCVGLAIAAAGAGLGVGAWQGFRLPSDWAVSVGAAAVVAAVLVGILVWHRCLAHRLGCPACGGELVRWPALVISSHRCYHCGTTILGLPDAETSV